LNLTQRLHQCTPELFWAEDPLSLRCWGKRGAKLEKRGAKLQKRSAKLEKRGARLEKIVFQG
jgi:hypothetical protein